MTTVNISLPDKLKAQADAVVKSGYYASFSDFIRSGARLLLEQDQLYSELEASRTELRLGKGKVLKSLKDLR